MSIPGYFSPIKPHSRPAWIAFTAGFFPKSRSKTLSAQLSTGEFGFGFHPGYPSSCSTAAPPSLNAAPTCSVVALSDGITDDRLEVTTLTAFPSVVTTARLFDVSTRPGTARLIASTPCGAGPRRDVKQPRGRDDG